MAKLKVYRTAIGFHDAYVAATSQKAALAAWGADVNLFARGDAELVEDEKLAEEPLAHPGEVIRRSRGTTAEHLAALPPDRPASAAKKAGGRAPARKAPRGKGAAPAPRPSRSALDAAEQALERAVAAGEAEARTFQQRQAALDRERRAAEKAAAAEVARLEQARDRERQAYDRAIKAWRA